MYELQQLADKLALINTVDQKIKPITVDFCAKELQYRCKPHNLTKEALAKAIGKHQNKQLTIIDTTAGFGNDAFMLATLGYKVLLIERSPIMIKLLQDGLKRAQNCLDIVHVIERLSFIPGDAIQILEKLPQEQYPDIIYLDPMFPERRKSALVKKEMRVLHDLVGEDLDCNMLLSIAIKIAKLRVIVKRPRLAPAIDINTTPSFILKGTACRFDVYIV
jgi:16S rRNA (guanine1516-N2)-methyltransferase